MPEIETKLLLTVLGLDKTENGYRVTATAVMPAESQNGATTRTDVESEEVSVSAALEKLSLKMGKRLELGLCGVVVVGDTFGDESPLPHLKYLLSSGKIIPGAYLIFADGMPAKKAIEMTNALSEASSNGLSTLVEHNALKLVPVVNDDFLHPYPPSSTCLSFHNSRSSARFPAGRLNNFYQMHVK